jgi:hypothetical protein
MRPGRQPHLADRRQAECADRVSPPPRHYRTQPHRLSLGPSFVLKRPGMNNATARNRHISHSPRLCQQRVKLLVAGRPQFRNPSHCSQIETFPLSVNPLDSHAGWQCDVEETQGAKLNFPVPADADRKVSDLYDIIHPGTDPSVPFGACS